VSEDGDGWGTTTRTGGDDEFVERQSPTQSFQPKPKVKQVRKQTRPLIKDADNAWLID
jgi:hypothetical protein